MRLDDLQAIKEEQIAQREATEHHVFVCMGTACTSSGSGATLKALQDSAKAHGLNGRCSVTGGGCQGLCARGPIVAVQDENRLYQQVKPEDADAVIKSIGGEPVKHLVCPNDIPFFTRQERVVLEFGGFLNPDKLEDYIGAGGFFTLLNILEEQPPAEVIEEVTRSGLRGRGGAGYPTGLKWSTVAKATGTPKYVICNGDEGDPGAYMDRSVMENYPFRVLEGMAIAAYAVGASKGFLYVRAEYPLAVERLRASIKQCEKANLLGNSIGGTAFSFEVDVRLGAGAFVCGEETALIASIEGRRGQPRPRPPYPAEKGLWGQPTLINNAETFANIVPLLREGADWFSRIGTEKSRGTKVFSLTGAITNTGLIEVPMGITLREIIDEIGGGVPNGNQFKAVQTGGPSGGCIPAQYLDLPVDYESLASVGSIMGSGGMIVMDEHSCMVDVAKYFIEFCMTESCGKCIPCRVGTAEMYRILDRITTGEGTMEDITLLEELCDMVKNTSLCGLGQAAPNPVVSTLRYFRDEYIAHIVERRCPAGVCQFHNAPPLVAEYSSGVNGAHAKEDGR